MIIRLTLLLSLLLATSVLPAQDITLPPSAVQEDLLDQALQVYRELEANNTWAIFSDGTCLRPGESGENILKLRQNLILTSDLKSNDSISGIFDQPLTEALRKFQLRHGLEQVGYVDAPTLEALNITPAQRIRQLEINVIRWKTDSMAQQQRSVFINIPDFTLHLLDSTHRIVWQTPVIVGQAGKAYQTIPLQSTIQYLVLNPSWVIPQSIIRNEIIPVLKSNPDYLVRNGMHLYRLQNGFKTEVPARTINWKNFDIRTENITIIQEPSLRNAMGKLKFIFPNQHAIYLHDTPVKVLFSHRFRAYSHGCVRVKNPEILAAFLLTENWQATPKTTAIKGEQTLEKTIYLPKPIPIKIGYYTCWVDTAGALQFRKDIYGLDKNEPNPSL